MVSKCANPSCSAVFLYLRDGTIFHFVPRAAEHASDGRISCPERFWLCSACAKTMTLISGPCGIQVVPLPAGSERENTECDRPTP
jgi:hypothetical protein